MHNRTYLPVLLIAIVSGCVQTGQLYAVRDASKPLKTVDDQPRVVLVNEVAKPSFVTFLQTQCAAPKPPKWQLSPTTGIDGYVTKESDWAHVNPKSAVCAARVAAYAVDQCRYMTLKFNKATLTTKILVEGFSVAAALATDGVALAHPNSTDKTAIAALAAAVAGNASSTNGLGDPLTATPADMIDAAPKIGEAVGLDDDTDFKGVGVTPSKTGQDKFARLHDAALSMCAANLIGIRRAPSK